MKSGEGLSQGVLLYGYAVLLGVSYILAFWRPFGFNVFPYLSFSDILLTPLNRLSVLLAMVVLVALSYVEKQFRTSIVIPFYGFVVVMLLHFGIGCINFAKILNLFFKFEFGFANEAGVIGLCAVLLILAFSMAYQSFLERDNIFLQLLAVILVQIQLVLSAGYSDGKALFNGAYNVHFLEQKKLCDDHDVRDWVYIERFGGNAFFMNTIDKRLCILNEIKFNLISRKYRDEL